MNQVLTLQAIETLGKSGAKKSWRLINGDEQNGFVLAEIIVDSAKSAATGYVTSSIGRGVGVAAETVGLGGITGVNAHLAIAAGIVQSSKSLMAYLDNRIDAGEMLAEIYQTSLSGTGKRCRRLLRRTPSNRPLSLTLHFKRWIPHTKSQTPIAIPASLRRYAQHCMPPSPSHSSSTSLPIPLTISGQRQQHNLVKIRNRHAHAIQADWQPLVLSVYVTDDADQEDV